MMSQANMVVPPGPRRAPLVGLYGNILPFLRNPVTYMQELHHRYGDIASLSEGTSDYVFTFAPGYNQQILGNPALFFNADADSSPIRVPKRATFSRILAGALNQMNGPRHKQQRRLMMPAFHKQRIEAYRDDIVAMAEQYLAAWQFGQQLEMLAEMRQLTLNIAVKTLIGLDPNQGGGYLSRQLERWQQLFFSTLTILLPVNLPGLPYHGLLKGAEALIAEIQQIIARKRARGIDDGDVLSILLQAHDEEDGSRLTDEELIGQTITLFIAGHETTASALTWTLFLLAQHPQVLAALLAELDSKLEGRAPAMDQINDLPLLDGVIKESMRLLPPFIWQMRFSQAPCELGPYALPQGAAVIVSSIVTHHRSDLYPQPDKFWPERWLTINPTAYEYFPFSAGPRMCLGATFAMLELKIVLAIILQRYRLSLPPQVTLDRTGLIFSVPKGGLPMQVNPPD
ncbi:MAG TPA: cytochrome P450, partial [Anaerolineae bacterium]|nr:cytochrome P450 [Anaerolineae bacterium]